MYRTNAEQSLDWLVSPVLNFGGQTITFWAYSSSASYLESMEVRYSTGDPWLPDLMANEPLLSVEVPAVWTKYEVEIPAEARHFAIRCTSKDKMALFLDDISYFPGTLNPDKEEHDFGLTYEKLLGFNIYCNGEKINDEPVFADEYLESAEPGTYSFEVKAVYEGENGQPVESEASNKAEVTVAKADMTYPEPVYLQGESSIEGVSLTWEQPAFDVVNTVTYTETFDGTEAGDDPVMDAVGAIQSATYNGLKLINRNGQKHFEHGIWPWARSADAGMSGTGCIFSHYNTDSSEQCDDWIITPRLNGRAQTVTFEYMTDSDPETFEVLYTTNIQDYLPDGTSMDDYGIWTLAETVEGVTTDGKWETMTLELPEGVNYVAIRHISSYRLRLLIDNLTYQPLELPSNATASGSPARVTTYFTGYNVYRDGVKVNTAPVLDTEYLDADVPTGVELTYTVTALYGKTGESEPSNEVTVYVLPDPAPEAINAAITPGGIAVEWNAPDLTYRNIVPTTEDFEGYDSYKYGGPDAFDVYEYRCELGDFVMVNRSMINHQDPKQEYLPWFLNDSDNDGNTCLSTTYSNQQQDDWIISPLLSGASQTISLDVKVRDNSYGPEVLQFLYTTDETCDVPEGTSMSEFGVWTEVETRDITNMTWERISFDIPEDATHFAIRCLSQDKHTMNVDNITYIKADMGQPKRALRQLQGYNIYLGDEKLNESLLIDTSFHIPAPGFGVHPISVSAVYAHSEAKSEPFNFLAHPNDIHLPAVKVVDGSAANGEVSLTWEAPEVPEGLLEYLEDFSSATEQANVVDSFNGWTAINAVTEGDGNHTHNGLSFWEQGVNPWYIELDPESTDDAPNYYLADGYSGNYVDDWFISPRSTGVKSMQFDARITMLGFPDVIQVLATPSHDCTDLSSYTLIETVAPKSITNWTNYSVDLPEGTMHFALRSYNEAKDGLHIDNIAWQREVMVAEGFIGYNIYRKYSPIDDESEDEPETVMARTDKQAEEQDFVKVNDQPITDRSHSEILETGNYHYLISAVYPWGESEMSPVRTVYLNTGIENLKAGQTNVAPVYYTIDGIRVDNPRPGSVYIEVRGNKASKVFVK